MTPCFNAAKTRVRARPFDLRRLIACAALAAACATPPPQAVAERPPEAWRARRELQEARAFWAQGRIEAAERATRRGLEFDDGDADLHRLRAHLLAELGREDEAARQRTRADALDPPPPPPPDEPHPLDRDDRLVVLLPPPDVAAADRDRIPHRWPHGDIARTLRERLAVRLPSARVEIADPATTAEARTLLGQSAAARALTLRVDRSFFATTRKDGSFGLAWLAWGAAGRGGDAARGSARSVVDMLITQTDPRREALARALEVVLASEALAVAASADARFEDAALATLFPRITARSEAMQQRGRALLARGELEAARDAFADAVEIAPSHSAARIHLADTEAALAIARQLRAGASERVELDPQLSELEEARLEAQLRDARTQRDRLAASLEMLEDASEPPSDASIAALSPGGGKDALRPLALIEAACAGVPTEDHIRTLYTPGSSGAVRALARFYFADLGATAEPSDAARRSLCLRADDRDEDGRMDTWTAYRAGVRVASWHDQSGDGSHWNIHVEYDETGQAPLQTSFRGDSDEAALHRRILYVRGRLSQEWRDTNADGRFDTFDQYGHPDPLEPDAPGELVVRAEDLDGDGVIDVRSVFEGGRLVRREWLGEPPATPGTLPTPRPAP